MMMADGERNTAVTFSEKQENLTILKVLEAFNAPINEEQAWAVCFQAAIYAQTDNINRCFCGLNSLYLNKDGTVVQHKAGKNSKPEASECDIVESLGVVIYNALDYGLAENEEQSLSQSLESLIAMMTGSCHDNHHNSDEGYQDPDYDRIYSLGDVIQHCTDHLPCNYEAANHYKAVCRALVTEAFQLLDFLEKVSSTNVKTFSLDRDSNVHTGKFEEICRAEWARIWMQVIRDLRQGVKLKKVTQQLSSLPVEYELTPYEILMEDIRLRRYNLKQVLVNGSLTKKESLDPHDIILNFIRSRPPLQPAEERKLKEPPPKEPILHELLLEGIKHPPNLRPTPSKPVDTTPVGMTREEKSPEPKRRLIKPNLAILSNDDDSSSEDDLLEQDTNKRPATNQKLSPSAIKGITPLQKAVAMDIATQKSPHKPERRHSITICESPQRQVEDGSNKMHARNNPASTCVYVPHAARPQSIALPCKDNPHSVSKINISANISDTAHGDRVLNEYTNPKLLAGFNNNTCIATTERRTVAKKSIPSNGFQNCTLGGSSAMRTQNSRTTHRSILLNPSVFYNISGLDNIGEEYGDSGEEKSTTDPTRDDMYMYHTAWKDNNDPVYSNDVNNDFTCSLDSSSIGRSATSTGLATGLNWCNPLDSLSLTIEEVTHIRTVLSKAELESLINNPRLYELVSKGKVCFSCKSTKFSIFGSWSTTCKFCKRKVCSKCIQKMRIPTDHFENIPVYTLSPTKLTPKNLTEDMGIIESTGSTPPSPVMEHKNNKDSSTNGTLSNGHPFCLSLESNTVPDMNRNSCTLHTNSDKASIRGSKLKKWASFLDHPKKPHVLQGTMGSLCKDCKSMMCNVIRSSRMSLSMSTMNLHEISLPRLPSPGGDTKTPSLGTLQAEKKRRKVTRHQSLNIRPSYTSI